MDFFYLTRKSSFVLFPVQINILLDKQKSIDRKFYDQTFISKVPLGLNIRSSNL